MNPAVVVYVLCIMYKIASGQDCGKSSDVGSKDPSKIADRVDSKSGQMFMARDEAYRMTCCGVISEWRFHIHEPGTIRLLVWRGLGTGEYVLVGENIATYNKGEENRVHTVRVAEQDRISVELGDYVGWYNEGDPMVSYSKGKKEQGILIMGSKKAPKVGDLYKWSGVKATDPRNYAIGVSLAKNSEPKFVNLNADITVTTGLSKGTEIYLLMVSDLDPDDHSNAIVTMETFEKYFQLDNTTRSLIVTDPPPEGKYTLNFVVRDHCGASNKGTLKMTVKIKLPTIASLPTGVSVREDLLHQEVLLHVLDVIHSGPIACELKKVAPSVHGHPFLVRNVNDTEGTWGVYLKSTAELAYVEQDSYTLSVRCYAGKEADLNDLIVSIIPNDAPRFLNLPASTSVSATDSHIGKVIYHVTVNDTENDVTFFNMTCDPEPCAFDISRGGSVQLVEDLRSYGSQLYYLNIFVEDRYHINGPEVLVVNVTDLNRPPFIVNIPDKAIAFVAENTPIGAEIFQVIAGDPDPNDTITYSLVVKPKTYAFFFTIDPFYGNISTAFSLDFERLKSKIAKLSVTVTDGHVDVARALKVNILDVNEPPVFTSDFYVLFTDEGKPGKTLKSHIKAKDADNKDELSFKLNCGNDSNQFQIDDKTGDIILTYGFDVDSLQVEEHKSMCGLTAVDSKGLNSTVALEIVVKDIDDNAPEFERTSYLFIATRDLPVFSTIGQARAVDKDTASINSKLLYTTENSTKEFIVDDNGTLYLITNLENTEIGTVYRFTVTAEDGGMKSDMVQVTVVVLAGDYTTVTSSLAATPLTFFDLPENVAWIVTLVYLLASAASLVFYLALLYLRCRITRRDHPGFRNANTHAQAPFQTKRNNLHHRHYAGRRRSSTVSILSPKSTTPASTWTTTSSVDYRSKDSNTEGTSTKGSRASRSLIDGSNTSMHPSEPWSLEDIDSVSEIAKTKGTISVSSQRVTPGSYPPASSASSPRITSGERKDVTSDYSSANGSQRKCSLSDIKPTYLRTKLPWKPWAISDFKSESTASDKQSVDSSKSKNSKHNGKASENLQF